MSDISIFKYKDILVPGFCGGQETICTIISDNEYSAKKSRLCNFFVKDACDTTYSKRLNAIKSYNEILNLLVNKSVSKTRLDMMNYKFNEYKSNIVDAFNTIDGRYYQLFHNTKERENFLTGNKRVSDDILNSTCNMVVDEQRRDDVGILVNGEIALCSITINVLTLLNGEYDMLNNKIGRIYTLVSSMQKNNWLMN